MFTVTDPYEEARLKEDEAKLLTPEPAKKNRKVVVMGLVGLGLLLSMVILANVAGMVAKREPSTQATPKPSTMTAKDSQNFAQQQAGQAAFIQGSDADKRRQVAENTVLGEAKDIAADAYEEEDGVPKKTKAQDEAEHGRTPANAEKSQADQMRERAMLEAQHRRQNDLDSSPVSVDFADYFEKERAKPLAVKSETVPQADTKETLLDTRRKQRADVLREASEEAETAASHKVEPHDPSEDYVFDRSFGKLYRLMEDTIIETVLVNRLNVSTVGPVICMVTTDVYSQNGTHLLVAKGTRLLGNVRGVASTNQERLFVAFHRMIMPDGYSVSLDQFQGLDVVGQAGLRDLVNHHYVQIFGTSIALAAVSATTQMGNNSSYGTYDWSVGMRNGMSQGLGQSAQRVMERFMNILPTFTIRERARVKVMLSGDLLLPDTKNHGMDPDL
jgi:type IV secretion system protein VirB10